MGHGTRLCAPLACGNRMSDPPTAKMPTAESGKISTGSTVVCWLYSDKIITLFQIKHIIWIKFQTI